MIADHHPGTGRELRVRGPGGVRQDHAFDAAFGQEADAGGDRTGRVTFVKMHPPLRIDHPRFSDRSENELACMTGNVRPRQVREIEIRNALIRASVFDQRVES